MQSGPGCQSTLRLQSNRFSPAKLQSTGTRRAIRAKQAGKDRPANFSGTSSAQVSAASVQQATNAAESRESGNLPRRQTPWPFARKGAAASPICLVGLFYLRQNFCGT